MFLDFSLVGGGEERRKSEVEEVGDVSCEERAK
jgi:hypothetical protein